MKAPTKYWFLRERLVFGIVSILTLTGIFTWFNINEQEDPFFPYRNGFINIDAPGMAADAIENSIVRPLERELNGIDEVSYLTTEVSDGVGSIDVKLHETTYDTDAAWQLIRDKVNSSRVSNSAITTEIQLQDRAQDTQGILLAINTTKSLLETRQFAFYLRDELYKLSAIRDVSIVGDPGARIEVFYPQELMLETNISPIDIANHIEKSSAFTDIGKIKSGNFQSNIEPIKQLDSVDDLRQIDIKTIDGEVLNLAQLTDINIHIDPDVLSSFWVNGEKKIGLSIALPPNQTRVVDVGDAILDKIAEINQDNPAFNTEPIFFQPKWTEERRSGLAKSLLLSSLGVGLVLFFLMSKKLALVVSLTIPAIALTSLAFFGLGGGVLQQMSIAGMVISLGLMVDNSIVMAELIARYRDAGLSAIEAAQKAMRELYRPLATSTFTTIAAFVPMLLSQGDVADFIRMVPVIVVITIFISYLYALVLLPTMTINFKRFATGRSSNGLTRIGSQLGVLGTSKPKSVILSFFLLLIMSFVLVSDQDGEFFPKSARNQAFIDIQGDFGLSHNATLETVKDVETILSDYSEIEKVVSFVGNSGPRFYYNMTEAPNQPNVARIVFMTKSNDGIPELVTELNKKFNASFKSERVNAKEIGQGPPIEAPIEIRVLGDDRKILLAASEEIFSLVNEHPETTNTRRGYVVGKPKLSFQIDNNNVQKAGLTQPDISKFIAWRTNGLWSGSIAGTREILDIVIVDKSTITDTDASYLMNTVLISENFDFIPMSSLASDRYISEEAVLTRQRGFNAKMVSSDVKDQADEEEILAALMPEFRRVESKYRVAIEFGGEAEEQEGSGSALVKVLPVGAVLLFSALMVQFNSFRIAGLVMLTIPLAMVGVRPMLSIAGVNFGFMSVLGLLALTGIVVNTAIILIDKVLVLLREEQMDLVSAINTATTERFKPVLLTTTTTIVGMIPLTSPESPLWPPLAWTIIGGLITSTILTLIVLPSFLTIFLRKNNHTGN